MSDPRKSAHGASPEQILAAPDLSRERKIELLREMSYDAREMDVASGEGMAGGAAAHLGSIQRALRALGVEDDGATTTTEKNSEGEGDSR